MKKNSIVGFFIVVILALFIAIALNFLSNPQLEALKTISNRIGDRDVKIVTEPLRYRGVVCGRYISGDTNRGGWKNFVYISHYSSESPLRAKLFLSTDAEFDVARSSHGCR